MKRRKRQENLELNLDPEFLLPDEVKSFLFSITNFFLGHFQILSPMNSDLFLFSNYLPQTPPPPEVALLSPDDLQRIEYIQLLYHRRIELGK